MTTASAIDQQEIYSNFIDSLKSPETKKIYAHFLKVFMKFHQIPEEDYASLFVEPERRIKQYLVEASKKDYSKFHFAAMISALKNFYRMNDINTINWDKVKRFVGETKQQHQDRAYTHEEIFTLVQAAPSLKMKAMICLMASAGLRLGAVPNLKVGHLQRCGDLYKVAVYEGLKGKGHYSTYCTPESTQLIDSYLDFRKRCGEVISKDSILFRKDFDTQFHEAARNRVQSITIHTIRTNLQRLLVKTGIREVDHVNPVSPKDVKMSHGFRKFFVTQLVNSGIHDIIIKRLSGHKLGRDMTFVYSKQTDEEVLQEYEKAIEFLTISPENKLKRELKEEREKVSEFEALVDRVASLENQVIDRFGSLNP